MLDNQKELHELQDRITRLSVGDQLYLIARVAGRLHHDHFTDHEAGAKAWAEFVEQWTAQGGEKYPYPVPPEYAPPEPHAPR